MGFAAETEGGRRRPSAEKTDAEDVVLYGLNMCVPLMSESLLQVCAWPELYTFNVHAWGVQAYINKQLPPSSLPPPRQYPKLCNQYFKLVSFLCEAYAAKVAVQDNKLLTMLGASLRLGLQGFGTTVAKYALEAMASLAGYGNECTRRAQPLSAEFEGLCTQLLHGVFEAVLVDKFDSALMDPAAEALFPLICLLQVRHIISTLSRVTHPFPLH